MTATSGAGPIRQPSPRPPWPLPGSMVARMWRGLAVFVLLALGASILVYLGVQRQDAAVDRVVEHLQPLQVANAELRAGFADSQALLRAYLDTGQPTYLRGYRTARAALTAGFPAAARLASDVSAADAASVRSQQQAAGTWFGFGDRMLRLPGPGPALSRLTSQAAPSASAFYAANSQLRRRLQAESSAAIGQGQQAVDRSVLIGALLAALAVLLGVAVTVATARSIATPLRGLCTTLERLAGGDFASRARVAGAAETRQVALSLNVLAENADRMHQREEERSRLGAIARSAGLRIREHLSPAAVLAEARAVLERDLRADSAYLHLIEEGRFSPPLGHEDDWLMPPSYLSLLSAPPFMDMMADALHRGECLVIQDLHGPEGEQVPPEFREPMLGAGIAAVIVAPFGVGEQVLGLAALTRRRQGDRWSPAEVDAVESIATDLGRGLQHARMYEAENQLVRELRELDRMKSDFLATVSHELRTPLTSIAGFVELLRDHEPGAISSEQDRMLETIDRNTARLRRLIEDVLTLSRIESKAFRTAKQPVDLSAIASDAAQVLGPQAGAKDVALSFASPGGVLVAGDAGQLDRMVINLLSNAVKFTPEGGRVQVGVVPHDGSAVITVSDTGIGIPEADQKGLFTRFFRASNATERSIPGTGLGLTIVHAIVDNHGGDLAVASREGEGTTITVRIPLLTTGGAAPQQGNAPAGGGSRR